MTVAPKRSARADKVRGATAREWKDKTGAKLERRRGGMTMVVTQEPELILNGAGDVIGVDAWIQVFDAKGQEVPVDPHRRIINPPTVPRAGVTVRENPDDPDSPIRELAEDPLEAFWEAVWDSVEEAPNPKGWRTRGTVTTVYSSTADGVLFSWNQGGTDDTSYEAARAGTANLSAHPTSTEEAVGQTEGAGFSAYYQIRELFLLFDLTAIPSGDTKSSIALNMWLVEDRSGTDFTLEARHQLWSPTLDTTDWVAGASLSGFTLMASLNSSGIGATGAYKTFTSDPAMLGSLTSGSSLPLMLSSSRQRLDNRPTVDTDESLVFSMSEVTGTTQDPKLVITHAATGFSGGAQAKANVTATGGGKPATSGGSQATVTVAGQGAGKPATSGGTTASVTVSVTGGGEGGESAGGSQTTVTVAASGAGYASFSGGSQASIGATAAGAGVANPQSGSTALVAVKSSGGGRRITGDITITVGPTRTGLSVGPSHGGLSIGLSRIQRGA